MHCISKKRARNLCELGNGGLARSAEDIHTNVEKLLIPWPQPATFQSIPQYDAPIHELGVEGNASNARCRG